MSTIMFLFRFPIDCVYILFSLEICTCLWFVDFIALLSPKFGSVFDRLKITDYFALLLRCRRKEERSKQGHTNNKAKQQSTPKAVTFPKKTLMSCLGWDSNPQHSTLCTYGCISMYKCIYANVITRQYMH